MVLKKTKHTVVIQRRSSSMKSVSRYFWCLQRHLWAAKFEFNIKFLAGKIIKFKFIIEFKFSRSQVALQASKISGYTLLTWTSPSDLYPLSFQPGKKAQRQGYSWQNITSIKDNLLSNPFCSTQDRSANFAKFEDIWCIDFDPGCWF